MAGKSKYDDRRIWMNTGVEAKLRNLANEEATLKRTHKIYQQASRDIERQVQSIYDELGVLDKANHWNFKGLNNPATKKSITELRKAVEAAGLADYLPEPLRNRMSVIEVKQLSNWLTLQKAGQDSHALTKDALLKTMQNQGKVWQSALEAGAASFVGFDRNICGYMMGANWEGGNFSSRLWNATNETWEKVRDELTRALANGQQPGTTKKHIRQLLKEAHNPGARGSGGLDYDVERIIRTENAKAATEADIVRWRESGVDKVQWLAVLEAHTCGACQERDGRVYELKKILDRPPLHPNCRCTLVPYDELIGNDDDTREYKNADGEYTTVQFAPYQALMTPGGALRSTALKVTDYFWQVSPWMTYTPPKTNISYTGEVDTEVADLIDRTIKAVTDQYPVIGDELAERYDNTITLHRGSTVFNGRKLDGVGGITDHTNGQLTITYPTGMRKKVLTELAELADKEKAQGFWSTGAANHAIIHELGHVYADYLKSYGISIDNIVIKAAGKRTSLPNALKELKVGVSRYAGENADEAFAELFARLASQDLKYYDKTVADFQKAILSELENKLSGRAELSGGANAAAKVTKPTKLDDFRSLSRKDQMDELSNILDNQNVQKGANEYTQYSQFAEAMGLNGKPTILDDAAFDKKVADGEIKPLYRGIHGNKTMTAAQVDNQFRTGAKAYYGLGDVADGIYFAVDKNAIKHYEKTTAIMANANERTSARITAALKPGLNVMNLGITDNPFRTIKEEYPEVWAAYGKALEAIGKNRKSGNMKIKDVASHGNPAMSIAAIANGYDGIEFIWGLDGYDYYCVFDRKNIIVRKNHNG